VGWLGSGMRVSASFQYQLRWIALYRLAHGGGGREECLTPCRKGGGMSGLGNILGICPREKYPGGNVLHSPSCGVCLAGCPSVTFIYCAERLKIRPKLLWKANRKLYPSFRMVPFSMTLNDLKCDLAKYSVTQSIAARPLCNS